jgi:hypothetical protein
VIGEFRLISKSTGAYRRTMARSPMIAAFTTAYNAMIHTQSGIGRYDSFHLKESYRTVSTCPLMLLPE